MTWRPRFYGLSGTQVVPIDSVIEWGQMMESKDRIVKQEYVGDVFISTVFLGIDHSFKREGPPLFFATMVFGGKLDQEQDRYSTWEEALQGHTAMVARVKEVE